MKQKKSTAVQLANNLVLFYWYDQRKFIFLASSNEMIKTPNLSGSDFLSLVSDNGGNCENRFYYVSVAEKSLRGEPANFEEASDWYRYKRCSQIMDLMKDLEN